MSKLSILVATAGLALYLTVVVTAMHVARQPVFETVVPKSSTGTITLGDRAGVPGSERAGETGGILRHPGEIARLPVYGSGDQHVGRVSRVTMGSDGRIKWIQVETGGFLGLGSRTVRIGSAAFTIEADRVRVALTAREIEQLPEMNNGPR